MKPAKPWYFTHVQNGATRALSVSKELVTAMKGKRNKKKHAQVNGMDLVDWFLAIDACLS